MECLLTIMTAHQFYLKSGISKALNLKNTILINKGSQLSETHLPICNCKLANFDSKDFQIPHFESKL